MSAYQTIKDTILYLNRPFTSRQIVRETGVCYETVKKYLQKFIVEGHVKLIGKDKDKNIYVRSKYKENSSYRVTKQKHYTLKSIQDAYLYQLKKNKDEFDDLFDGL